MNVANLAAQRRIALTSQAYVRPHEVLFAAVRWLIPQIIGGLAPSCVSTVINKHIRLSHASY